MNPAQILTKLCMPCLLFGMSGAPAQDAPDPSSTEHNRWIQVSDQSVGQRFSPGLVYVPKRQRFVLFGGRISGMERPYDVLSFDLAGRAWENELPEALRNSASLRGNVKVASFGKDFAMQDEGGLARPHAGMSVMWYTYTLAPWDQKIYALICGHTVCYDPATRTWTDLNPPQSPVPVAKDDRESLNWGALCADPLNKELLLFGGGGVNTPTGAPGTWVYSVEQNAWRKLEGTAPGPRALAPMVCDPAHNKIVLFGGDRLNMLYADTWVYDCTTRTWTEAKPPLSPAPRFGHGLVYLPKSKKILLAGGNTYMSAGKSIYRNLPYLDAWTYDVGANTWELLACSEDEAARPKQKDVEAAVMAANEDDVVLYVPGDGHSRKMERTTWIFRAETSKPDPAGTQKLGVPPGTVQYRENGFDPDWYKQDVPPPDVAKHEAFLKSVPANQWVLLEPPKWPINRWGGGWATIALDPDNDQILHHGGGHSAYFGDEVAHYSIPENRFSISYRPSFPLEHCGKLDGPGDYSFTRGPWGNHSYHAYTYDPACKRMVYLKKHLPLYDPVQRTWPHEERVAYPFEISKYHNFVTGTPQGAVCWAGGQGIFRLENGKAFTLQHPAEGLPRTNIDGSTITYDSKRDLIYLTTTPLNAKDEDLSCGQVWVFDPKTKKLSAKDPKGMEKVLISRFARESAYVAHEDLVMFGCLLECAGRVVIPFYDPAANAWFYAELPESEYMGHGRHPKKLSASVDLGMAYDAKRELVWTVLGRFQPGAIKCLRVDRKTLNLKPF